jgi:hypothetical protein
MPGDSLPTYGNQQIQSAYDLINSQKDIQDMALAELEAKNTELLAKQNIQVNQLKEIEDKEKLLLTRSRMLQIAQDRNAYKKKIIYTLIAAIFIIFIFTLVTYVFFVRKINMAK